VAGGGADPRDLFATMHMPMPVPQMRMPRSTFLLADAGPLRPVIGVVDVLGILGTVVQPSCPTLLQQRKIFP